MKTTQAFAKLSSTFPAAVLSTLCVILLAATADNLDAQILTWQPAGPVIQQPIIQQPYYPPQNSYPTPAPNVIIGEVVYGNETIGGTAPSGIPQTEPIQDFETAPAEFVPGDNEQVQPTPIKSASQDSASQPTAVSAIESALKDTSDPNIANEIIRRLEDELFKSHAQVVDLYSKVEILENQLTYGQGQGQGQGQFANGQQNDATKPDNPSAKSDDTESASLESAAVLKANEELVNSLSLARQQNSTLRTELEQLTANLDLQKKAASRKLEQQQTNEQAAMKEQYERQINEARSKFAMMQKKVEAEKIARRQQVAQFESQLLATRNNSGAKDNAIREAAEMRKQGDAKRAAQAQQIAQLELRLTDVQSKMNDKDKAMKQSAETQRRQDSKRAQEIAQLQKHLEDSQIILERKKISYEKTIKELQNRPMTQPEDSPASAENPFERTTENADSDADSATPADQQDSFFEDAMLQMQKLHDEMFEDIEAGNKRISERFSKRIERLDSSAPGFDAEKKRLNRDQQRLIREQELKIRQRWQKKLDSHMESTLETV